jgi:hypothetical protein
VLKVQNCATNAAALTEDNPEVFENKEIRVDFIERYGAIDISNPHFAWPAPKVDPFRWMGASKFNGGAATLFMHASEKRIAIWCC